MRFIDSHCHLDFSEFDENRDALIDACQNAGIAHFVVPGISLAQSTQLLCFSKSYPSVSIALGLHPYFLSQHQPHHLSELEQLAKTHANELVAIGECGLDRSIDNLDKQIALFEGQIELANQLALPLIVHHRQSHDLIARSFKRCKPKYPRAEKTRQVISNIAPQHLVLETDAPSMPLAGSQGQINTPLKIREVFTHLCELKGVSGTEKQLLADALYDSCSALFLI